MTESAAKVPVSKEVSKTSETPQRGRPFESFRHEVDRLFDEFGRDWRLPFRRGEFDPDAFLPRAFDFRTAPAVDIADREKAYEITAELPGLDEKTVEVKVVGHTLAIRGEKSEQKEEKDREYVLQERRYGSFERSFRIPENVDADKITATFNKGVLSVTLPKRAEPAQPEKKIDVKAA